MSYDHALLNINLLKHHYTKLCNEHYEQGWNQELVNWEWKTPLFVLCWCMPCHPFDLVGVSFQSPHVELMLSLLICWQTLWVRMRGKKMLYSALTRCSMKMHNSLMSTTSLQCPLFQVWAFLFPSRFIIQGSQSCFVLLYFSHDVWIVW